MIQLRRLLNRTVPDAWLIFHLTIHVLKTLTGLGFAQNDKHQFPKRSPAQRGPFRANQTAKSMIRSAGAVGRDNGQSRDYFSI
jgi:hypothetical protein